MVDHNQLKQWIVDLAAGFNFELKPGLVIQYLKILSGWKLAPSQWEELNTRILLRCEFFPRISQLYEIVCEILSETRIRENSRALDEIWAEPNQSVLNESNNGVEE